MHLVNVVANNRLHTSVSGMVNFHECSVNELEHSEVDADNMSLASVSISVLDQYVGHARESLGVETHLPSSTCSSRYGLIFQ